jgi:hypothetical protein
LKNCGLFIFKGKLTHENKGTTVFKNVGNYMSNNGGKGSVAGVMTRLQTAQTGVHILFRDFPHLQTHPYWPWDAPNLIFNWYQCSFLVVSWREHDIDHSPPSRAKVDNEWSSTSSPFCVVMACAEQLYHFYIPTNRTSHPRLSDPEDDDKMTCKKSGTTCPTAVILGYFGENLF